MPSVYIAAAGRTFRVIIDTPRELTIDEARALAHDLLRAVKRLENR